MESQLHWTQQSSGIDAQLREIRGAGVACVRVSHMRQTRACGFYSQLPLPPNAGERRQCGIPTSLEPYESNGSSKIYAQHREIRSSAMAGVGVRHMRETRACGLYSHLPLPPNARERRQSEIPASQDPWVSHGSSGIDAQHREIRSAAMAGVRVRHMRETRVCGLYLRLPLPPNSGERHQSGIQGSLDPWESHGSSKIDAQLQEIRSAAIAGVRERHLRETRASGLYSRLPLPTNAGERRQSGIWA